MAWRKSWLELGRENPTGAYVWSYMWWRSGPDNIFDLEEGLVCKDLGLNRKTLCKARSLIEKHGGFKRLYSRNALGQLLVRYQMLGFELGEQVPNSGPESESQETVSEPEPTLRNVVNRGHTVDTSPVAGGEPPIPDTSVTPSAIHSPREEKVSTASKDCSVAALPLPDGAIETEIHLTMDEKQALKQLSFEEAALEPKAQRQELFNWSQRFNRLFDDEEWSTAEQWYLELFPHTTEFPEGEILALAEIALDMQQRYVGPVEIRNGVGFAYRDSRSNPIREFWVWNQVHKAKKPGLVFYTVGDMARAWWSTDPRSARAQWERHDPECKDCAKVLPRYTRFDRTNYMVDA
jgi:hypothetical protein